MRFVIDLFGVAGMLTAAVIFQQKERRPMLLWKLASDVLWVVHYVLLGAYSGAAVMIVSVLRSLVLLENEHPGRGWLAAFLGISLTLSLIAWKDIFSLLALLCSFCSIIAFWIGRPKVTRLMTIPASTAYLIYNLSCGSLEGTISESLAVLSAAAGVIRFDLGKKKNAA